jgi:Arc/MetJ family transcription regulator
MAEKLGQEQRRLKGTEGVDRQTDPNGGGGYRQRPERPEAADQPLGNIHTGNLRRHGEYQAYHKLFLRDALGAVLAGPGPSILVYREGSMVTEIRIKTEQRAMTMLMFRELSGRSAGVHCRNRAVTIKLTEPAVLIFP